MAPRRVGCFCLRAVRFRVEPSFRPAGKGQKWLLQHQRALPTLSDADFVVSDLYKVHGIPALVLIGTDGKVKNYWEGEVSKPDLEAAIQQASQH